MSRYVYQIQGALEDFTGKLKSLRVLVCDLYNFDSVDVPIEILDKATAAYLQFRINLTESAPNIANLPYSVQNKIRTPLGRWLDQWILKNFYGDSGKSKNTNPGPLETGL
jgi:hypothetical protein